MQAIILAAGMGRRLGELTDENTKCMIKVNGITLIERMLMQLEKLRLRRIIIVAGYEAQKLKDFVNSLDKSTPIEWVDNPIYDTTNNIYSLFLAKEQLVQEDTLLLESDLIFEDSCLEKLLTDPNPNLALVAKYEHWMDGTVVTIDDERNITSFIAKKYFDYSELDNYYKTVNIYKFSKEFSRTHYVPFLEAYSKALGNNEYYEQVLRVIALLDKPEIKALPLDGQKWYEIDDIQDLDIAETYFSKDTEKFKKFELRYGGYWRFPGMIDFCYLVNPFFPSPRLVHELKANFDTLLREYPSGMKVNALLGGKFFNVRPEYVAVGNGAAELIKAFLDFSTGKIGMTFPTFEEYPNRTQSDRVIKFYPDNIDFSYNCQDLIMFFEDKDISTLLLINPDNPSGNFIPLDELLYLISWTKENDITLVVDESFIDFSNDSIKNSLLQNKVLVKNPHLIVIKSISKSYGVPGLRLGVIVSSNLSLINFIREEVSIWNINSFAEFFMQIYNKYEKDYESGCYKFQQERALFKEELQEINYIRVVPSQANYFLCEIIAPHNSRALTERLLLESGLLIKDCSQKDGFKGKQYVRIAIKSRLENQKLIQKLKEL